MIIARAIMPPLPCPCDTPATEMQRGSRGWCGGKINVVVKCSQINFRKSHEVLWPFINLSLNGLMICQPRAIMAPLPLVGLRLNTSVMEVKHRPIEIVLGWGTD